jgi:uncharacterized membrane protein
VSSTTAAQRQPGRSRGAGALVGVGVAAFLDETVFHQLLHWHHFYDRSTTSVGLVSDGVFHAFGFAAVVAGLFLFADLQRRGTTVVRQVLAGALLGFGAFQLYDGTVQHKLLRLHQIRYHVHLLPYDLAWDGVAVVALAVGVVLLRRAGP